MRLTRTAVRCGCAMVVAIGAGSFGSGGGHVSAATFTVTTLDPTGPGSLAAAVASAGVDTIEFATDLRGEIQLAGPLDVASGDLVINGPGSGAVTVSAATGDVFAAAGIELDISGLTLSGGTGGSGVDLTSGASLVLDDIVLIGAGDGVSGDSAGGITMSNSAARDLPGSGIAVEALSGAVTISSSEFIGNRAGIALDFAGQVAIADSVISDNGPAATTSSGRQGGVSIHSTASPVTIERSVISDNTAFFSSALTVGSDGDYGAPVSIVDSTITGNRSEQGAAVDVFGRDVSIRRSTFAANTGGLVLQHGGFSTTLLIENVTITANATAGYELVSSVDGAAVEIVHSTIAANTSTSSSRPDDQLFPAFEDEFRISHSIVSSAIQVLDKFAATSIDHSLLGSADEGTWSGDGNRFSDDPVLGPLGDHGGRTATMMPLIGSLAIDGGDPAVAGAPATDQRGAARIRNVIDIGAVEVDAGAVELDPATLTVAESASTIAITVTRSGGTEGAASVRVSTVNGTARAGVDFTAVNQLLRWAEGEFGSKEAVIPITYDDLSPEADKSFEVTLSDPAGVALGASTTVTVEITDVAPVALPELPATGRCNTTGPLAALAAGLLALGAVLTRVAARPSAARRS